MTWFDVRFWKQIARMQEVNSLEQNILKKFGPLI